MAADEFPVLGKIIRHDASFDKLIPADAKIEVLASGLDWSEGPVWVKNGEFLLFNDIPRNSTMKWEAGEGLSVFLKPSGYTGVGSYGNEPGANGLAVDKAGNLISCEHGDRRISQMPFGSGKRTLIDNYQGKRLNSPNDLAIKSNGDIYFTDPSYGLAKGEQDPLRELDYCGVFRLTPKGEMTLLTKEITKPNGIAFSADEKKLYVAQSDPAQAVVFVFDVKSDGTLANKTILHDFTAQAGKGVPGLPDGLKVDQHENIFATAPGGVHVLSPAGKLLGVLFTGQATGNCAWGDDGTTLYIMADAYLCRVKTTTKGAGW